MSSQEDLEEPWGQLVSMSGGSEERIPIVGEKFTVGRSKGSISYSMIHVILKTH